MFADCVVIENFNFIFQLFSSVLDFSILNLYAMNLLNSLINFIVDVLRFSTQSHHLCINILLFSFHFFSFLLDWL